MPKPVKKAAKKVAGTLPVPSKRKRPSDPMEAARAILTEHMGRVEQQGGTLSFEEQYRAHMAKLGRKGGQVSGAKRLSMPAEKRREIASKAARSRWAKRAKQR